MVFADSILSSNAVFTGLNDHVKPGAVAVKGNKILAVGSKEKIEKYNGPQTQNYDYDNQLIMAGFHDAHIHLMFGSLMTHGSVNLSQATTAEEAVQMLKRFADSRKEDEWIIGYGWEHLNWDKKVFPNRFLIDESIKERPVLCFHSEGHYTWVNSKALEIANVNRDTENPPAGLIEKDQHGEPTGILIEKASRLVTDYALDFPREKLEELFDAFLNHAAKLGVTSVSDVYGAGMDYKQSYTLFDAYDKDERLTCRIHLYPPMNGDIENVKRLREQFRSSKLQVTGLKQFIDGVVTGHTAYMVEPYTDKPDSIGETMFPIDTIRDWVLEADKEDFQIRFHAIGDGAVRLGLDVFEAAQKQNGVRDSRHTLEHIEVIESSDIPRFESLGVVPSVQPSHIALMPVESHTTRVREEKHGNIYPSKSLTGSTMKLAFGTDYPIAGLNPIKEIYHAVTRMDITGESVWNEKEKVTVTEALQAYTSGSAFTAFREHEIGKLVEGYLADIIVLDQNLFAINEQEIKDAKVILTMADGEVVYQKEQ